MFTGIVSHTGLIVKTEREPVFRLHVQCAQIAGELKEGDSVAVNGVCLSAVEFYDGVFVLELSAETLAKTTFSQKDLNPKVNLELPLRFSDRLGGHLVQGHVDGVGKVLEVKKNGEFAELFFSVPEGLARYLILKGSVTVNGVSLTLSSLSANSFGVSLIPATLSHTNLSDLEPGKSVNLETDMMAKYVESLLKKSDG